MIILTEINDQGRTSIYSDKHTPSEAIAMHIYNTGHTNLEVTEVLYDLVSNYFFKLPPYCPIHQKNVIIDLPAVFIA